MARKKRKRVTQTPETETENIELEETWDEEDAEEVKEETKSVDKSPKPLSKVAGKKRKFL